MIRACQTPTEFSFISCSETVKDHVTTLSFSFVVAPLRTRIIQSVHEIGTLQEFSFFIWWILVGDKCMNFLKSVDLSAEMIIVMLKYSISITLPLAVSES